MILPVDIRLTPRQIAEAFCELNDEQQAQVFIEAADIAKLWKGSMDPGWQWWSVGRHLSTCACSTDDARELVRAIANGTMDDKP